MSDRLRLAADRIREEGDLLRVLSLYGFDVREEYADREQQFPCKLHGNDNTPSARFYPESQTYHCWACGKNRDAIQVVREVEGVSFWSAIRKLEQLFGFEPLPWEPRTQDPKEHLSEQISEILRAEETYDRIRARAHHYLKTYTVSRTLSMKDAAQLWEAADTLDVAVAEGLEDSKATVICAKLLARAKQKVIQSGN